MDTCGVTWIIVATSKKFKSSFIILLMYIDDMLIIGYEMSKTNKLKRPTSQDLEMKDLEDAKQILGKSITHDNVEGSIRLTH